MHDERLQQQDVARPAVVRLEGAGGDLLNIGDPEATPRVTATGDGETSVTHGGVVVSGDERPARMGASCSRAVSPHLEASLVPSQRLE